MKLSSGVTSYKDLIVWQKSRILVKEIYIVTGKLPPSELYGLTMQMRRAAISIPSNIAEGFGRKSNKEYAQFFSIAYGSVLELETQLILATDLKFIQEKECEYLQQIVQEVAKMLNKMKSREREYH